MRIQKLATLYGSVTFRVEAFHGPTLHLHEPVTGSDRGGRDRWAFQAIAGMDEQKWREYEAERARVHEDVLKVEDAARDCLGTAGGPVVSNPGDFAADL